MYLETWFKFHCPDCKAKNWVCYGDASDYTAYFSDAVECHNCSKRQWLDSVEDTEYAYMLEEYEDSEGNIQPAKTSEQILAEDVSPEKGSEDPR